MLPANHHVIIMQVMEDPMSRIMASHGMPLGIALDPRKRERKGAFALCSP